MTNPIPCSVHLCDLDGSTACCKCLIALCSRHMTPMNRCEYCGTPRISQALFKQLFQDEPIRVLAIPPEIDDYVWKDAAAPRVTLLEKRCLASTWACKRCWFLTTDFYEYLVHVGEHRGLTLKFH